MHRPQRRAFFIGAIVEFLGILGLAFRFGTGKGGVQLVVIAGAALVVGMLIEVRAIIEARAQMDDEPTP